MDNALLSSKTNEHYTPIDFLAYVYEFLGHVDLDPCSSPLKTVMADLHYTAEMDGLSLPWYGNVFCNPPYGRGLMEWSQKIKTEYELGNIADALYLVPSRTDTEWTRLLSGYSRVYLAKRLKFLDQHGVMQDSAPFPSVLFYFGTNDQWFVKCWERLGDVRSIRPPKFDKTAYQREYMRKRRAPKV
ncbi:MAG: DNA N-6-adenine-methyltransferase [Microcoleus sp.]